MYTFEGNFNITVAEGTEGGQNEEARKPAKEADNRDKEAILKNCAPFTDQTSEINNTQVENANDLDVVMALYILIECSDNYSKTSGSLWRYYRDDTITNSG